MSFPVYTRADLCARVLARLSEVGVSSAAGASGGFAAGSYTQAQVIDRALARLGEVGFDLAAGGAAAPYTFDALVVRILAKLGEIGFGLSGPTGLSPVPFSDLYDRILARLGETGFDRDASVLPPALARTQADLVTRALTRLGEIGFGQAAESEAFARLNDLAPEVLAELVKRRVYLPIVVPIPAEAFDALATILASHASSDFGLPGDEITLLAQRAQVAEQTLKGLIFDYQGRVTKIAEAVMAELSADRLLGYPTTGSIAQETADAVSAAIANRACDDFGVSADRRQAFAAQEIAAVAKLRRLAFGFHDRVQTALPGILAELAADRMIAYPSATAIAPETFDAVASVAAPRFADEFGIPADRQTVMITEAQAADAKLRRLVYGYRTRVTAALPGILAEIQGARVYTFPADGSVPAEAADALSAILSARMASDFELDEGQRQILAVEAEAGRKRLIALGLPAHVAYAVPAILAELYTDRVYAFPVDDVIRPDAFDGLAAICSARLAADIAPDRAPILLPEAQMAEMRLRRMRTVPVPSETLRASYF